jgi:peroxiredoxin
MLIRSVCRVLPRGLTALIVVGFFLIAVSGAAAAFKNLKVGDQALPIELEDLEKNVHTLADYGDSTAVLLFFWATWSDRSLKELEDLVKLDEQYREKGLRIVAINVENQTMDSQDMAKIQQAVQDGNVSFPVLIDEGLKTYNEWGVIATPSTALVDRDGNVVFDLSSYPTAGYMEIETAVQKALGLYVEEEVEVAQKPSYEPTREALLHLGLGKRLMEKGFMSKAIPELEKSAAADSHYPDSHIYLGYAYVKDGKEEEAQVPLARAHEIDPQRPETVLLLAHLSVSQEKLDEAIDILLGKGLPEAEVEVEGKPQSGEPASAETTEGGTVGDEPADLPPDEVQVEGLVEETSAPEAADTGPDLSEVLALRDEGKTKEAAEKLDDIIKIELTQLGLPLEEEKVDPMEKMKLMMEKQGAQ